MIRNSATACANLQPIPSGCSFFAGSTGRVLERGARYGSRLAWLRKSTNLNKQNLPHLEAEAGFYHYPR